MVSLNEGEPIAAQWSAVYNLAPPPGKPAKFGFWTLGVPVTIEASVNESPPNNIIAEVTNVSQVLEVTGSNSSSGASPPTPPTTPCAAFVPAASGPNPNRCGKCPVGGLRKPFLTLPRACEGPLTTSYEADSWEHPGLFSAKGSVLTHDSAQPPNPAGHDGCCETRLRPRASVTPATSAAESPRASDSTSTSMTKVSPTPTATPSPKPTSKRPNSPSRRG